MVGRLEKEKTVVRVRKVEEGRESERSKRKSCCCNISGSKAPTIRNYATEPTH